MDGDEEDSMLEADPEFVRFRDTFRFWIQRVTIFVAFS